MRETKIVLTLALCIGLGACASGSAALRGVSVQPDAGKVAAVNRWAEGRGATVLWLNYPVRVVRDGR